MHGMLLLMFVQILFQFGAKRKKREGYYGEKNYLDMSFCVCQWRGLLSGSFIWGGDLFSQITVRKIFVEPSITVIQSLLLKSFKTVLNCFKGLISIVCSKVICCLATPTLFSISYLFSKFSILFLVVLMMTYLFTLLIMGLQDWLPSLMEQWWV